MAEIGEVGQLKGERRFTTGPYHVIKIAENNFALLQADPNDERFPDVSGFELPGEEEADGVAHMLGRAFQEGYGEGESSITYGTIRVKFSKREGGENCQISMLRDGKVVGRTIEATSPKKLINALARIYGKQK